MATCPSGHESADDDFCDVCGFAIGPAAVPATIAATAPAPCPHCGVPRAGQFCESCGYDFTASTNGGAAPPLAPGSSRDCRRPVRPRAPAGVPSPALPSGPAPSGPAP